jgi:hypothetical protein
MKIPERVAEMLASAGEHNFVTLTTLGGEGWPHSRPMDVFAITADGEAILFPCVNPGATVENLHRNRRAEIALAEREAREGYTLEGWAEYIAHPEAEEVKAARALVPERPVIGAFLFHVQRVRVSTPLVPETGQLMPGSQPRRQPAYSPLDFDVPSDCPDPPPPDPRDPRRF